MLSLRTLQPRLLFPAPPELTGFITKLMLNRDVMRVRWATLALTQRNPPSHALQAITKTLSLKLHASYAQPAQHVLSRLRPRIPALLMQAPRPWFKATLRWQE